MICLAPRAPGDSVRPRRLSGVGARPLNFTVRGRAKIELARAAARLKSRGQDPSIGATWCARGERQQFTSAAGLLWPRCACVSARAQWLR